MARDRMSKEITNQRNVKRRVTYLKKLTDGLLDTGSDILDVQDAKDLEEVQTKLEGILRRYQFV